MNVVLIGAGGHGKVVLDTLRAAGLHQVVGFLDADPLLKGQRIGGVEVLGAANLLPHLKGKAQGAMVSVGDNAARVQLARKVTEAGLELVNAIHPKSSVSPMAKLGKNLLVSAGAVISADAVIADSVIVNTGAIVEHECEISEGVHICPGAALAGRVRVGEGAFVGLGSRVIQCLTVGAGSVIGAGAVVIRDIPPGSTAVGIPAHIIRQN